MSLTRELVLDDGGLLVDRVLRSLHRNKEGHLSAHQRKHIQAIETSHNVAVLYVYTVEDDSYMLHEHYVFSFKPCTYKRWFQIVQEEMERLRENMPDNFYGVYGWLTSYLQITPLRTGDLLIKIDAEGASGVRLTFGS